MMSLSFSGVDQRQEHLRRRREAATSPWSRPPHALREMVRHIDAMRLFMKGLEMHYEESLIHGRLETWRKAAHGCIELAVDLQGLEVERRSALP